MAEDEEQFFSLDEPTSDGEEMENNVGELIHTNRKRFKLLYRGFVYHKDKQVMSSKLSLKVSEVYNRFFFLGRWKTIGTGNVKSEGIKMTPKNAEEERGRK